MCCFCFPTIKPCTIPGRESRSIVDVAGDARGGIVSVRNAWAAAMNTPGNATDTECGRVQWNSHLKQTNTCET